MGSPAKRNELCVEIHLLKQKRTCFDFCSYTQTHKQREKQLVHTPTHHTPSHIKNLRTFIKIFRNFSTMKTKYQPMIFKKWHKIAAFFVFADHPIHFSTVKKSHK